MRRRCFLMVAACVMTVTAKSGEQGGGNTLEPLPLRAHEVQGLGSQTFRAGPKHCV
jgi:hypothetical protein